MTGETSDDMLAIEDILDCGGPIDTERAFRIHAIRHAGMDAEIARKLRSDAADALKQAECHEERARGFLELAKQLGANCGTDAPNPSPSTPSNPTHNQGVGR